MIVLAFAMTVAFLALGGCDPGAFPISDQRTPPASEPKGTNTATPVVHGGPMPTLLAVDAGAD